MEQEVSALIDTKQHKALTFKLVSMLHSRCQRLSSGFARLAYQIETLYSSRECSCIIVCLTLFVFYRT